MSASQEKPIDVAIVGGGFCGLSLAIGLQKYKHINVQVYEGAHKFAEVGAGVALGPNSQRAMQLIDPRIFEGYEQRAAFSPAPPDQHGQHAWMTVYKGQAPDTDSLVAQYKHSTRGSTIHRAHFLDELIKLVEPERAHFAKRVDSIYETDDPERPVVLHFGDGTSASADVVIGCDGVKSAVRKHVLGPQDPAATALFSGCVIYRAVVPMEQARQALGEIQQKPGLRCGRNALMVGFPMANQTLFNMGVTVFDHGPWEHEEWTVPAKVADVKARFADWDPFAQKMVNLLPDDGTTVAWSAWDMPPARTYCKGRIAIAGDAAHATTPHQGAGAGQAIEDALVLERLLGKFLDPANRSAYPETPLRTVPLLLQAYDTVRRFRSQKVVATSREVGRLLSGQEPGVGMAAADIRPHLEHRMEWIWDLDQQRQVTDAFQIFESLRAAGERTAHNQPK